MRSDWSPKYISTKLFAYLAIQEIAKSYPYFINKMSYLILEALGFVILELKAAVLTPWHSGPINFFRFSITVTRILIQM